MDSTKSAAGLFLCSILLWGPKRIITICTKRERKEEKEELQCDVNLPEDKEKTARESEHKTSRREEKGISRERKTRKRKEILRLRMTFYTKGAVQHFGKYTFTFLHMAE